MGGKLAAGILVLVGFVSTAVAQAPLHRRVPADWDNVLHIPDLLPHLEAVLSSDAVRWGLVDSPDARKGFGGKVDLEAARRTLRAGAEYIPREVLVAAPSASWDGLDRAFRLIATIVYVEALQTLKPAAQRRARPRLQKAVLDALLGFQAPRVVLWVTMRSPGMADLAFRQAADLASAASGPGWRVERGDGTLGIHFSARDFIDEATLTTTLQEVALLDGPRDPRRRPLAAATLAIGFEVWLERLGDAELRITLGPRPPAAAPATAGGFVDSPDTIASSRWNLRGLKGGAAAWGAMLDEMSTGELGLAARQTDTEDLLGTLCFMAEQLLEAGDQGTLRLWSAGRALAVEVLSTGTRRAAPLAGASILKLVPPDAEAVWCSSEEGLGAILKSAFLQVEDRMATQELKADIADRDAEAARVAAITRAYYKHFAGLRDVVLHKLPPAAPGPGAVILSSDGRLERGKLSIAGEKPLEVTDVPMIDLVVLSKVRAPDEARRLLEDLWRQTAVGFAGTLERKLSPLTPYLRPRDLGLGVPTWAFEGAWLKTVADVELSAAGALQPHLFFVDDHLVLSTSARASTKILAAAKSGAAHPLPAVPAGAEVIEFGHVRRRTLVGMVDALVGFFAAAAKASGEDTTDFENGRLAARSVAATFEHIQVLETQTGPSRRTFIEMKIGKP